MSFCVFSGTPVSLAFSIFSSVFGAAKSLLLEYRMVGHEARVGLDVRVGLNVRVRVVGMTSVMVKVAVDTHVRGFINVTRF